MANLFCLERFFFKCHFLYVNMNRTLRIKKISVCFYSVLWMPCSILSWMRGEVTRWQKFLPNNLKGDVKYIIWMRKKREFCQILKYFCSKPSKKHIYQKCRRFLDLAEFFLYLAWPGLATVGKKMSLSK